MENGNLDYSELSITQLQDSIRNLRQLIKGCQYPDMLPEYSRRLGTCIRILEAKKEALDRK